VLVLILACTGVSAQTYSTTFPLTENPISENGHWITGKAVGLDWADVSTTPGLAIGLQTGAMGYDDATALLTGSWGPDQTVEATVYTVNQNDSYSEEVEIRLRSAMSAHSNTGYEILFKCSKTTNAYMEIVRWNGPLGNFTYLIRRPGAQYGVKNGDVVKATIVGNVITAYINGVEVARVTDSTYPTGNPGMGFFLRGPAGKNADYGFMSFTATGSAATPTASAPTATGSAAPPTASAPTATGSAAPATASAPPTETSGGGGGCFIATAAYGSPLAPEVEQLRHIRDRYLLSFGLGRHLVAVYYRLSQPLAAIIAHSPVLRAFTRVALTPVLAWAGLFLWSPILGVTAPLAALSLAGLGGMAWRRHRRA
jgi:hypothetical protein